MAQVIKAPLFAGDKNPKQANAMDNIKKFFNFYILNILNMYIYIYNKYYIIYNTKYIYIYKLTKCYKCHIEHLNSRSK